MGPFLPLFSVEVAHGYFPDDVCRTLRLHASAESARRIERSGCLLRLRERGPVVLFDASKVAALRLHAQDTHEPLRFHFFARATDPDFANYTDAPLGSTERLVMLDSQEAVQDPEAKRWRLHAGECVGTAEQHALDSSAATEALSPQERRAPPHFVVSVSVGLTEVNQALAEGEGRRYHARLGARATVWKYCLFGEWAESQDDVQVIDLAQTCEFGAAVGERLPDGQTMLAVRSAAPIALQERSDRRFQLRRRGNGSDKVLVKRLPVASPRQLNRETVGGVPTLVSEIYVHR